MFLKTDKANQLFFRLYSTNNNRKFEGKVQANILSSVIFPKLGAPNKDVLIGSKLGVDGALISGSGFNSCPIVVTSDPITGATADLGMRLGLFFFELLINREACSHS